MSIMEFLRALICPPPCEDEPVVRPFTILHHVPGSHVRSMLRAAFPEAHIRIADADYSTVSLDEFNAWLKNDDVSEMRYYAQHFDCDDSARAIRCRIFAIGQAYKTTIAVAYCEGYTSTGEYHAFNIFLDSDDDLWILEPQTDFVSTPDESDYKPDFIQL